MRGRYADYVYHLYDRPDVHIQVTDGRSYVRNASQQFDVVQMTFGRYLGINRRRPHLP